ncbi:MAG: hypothetical protein D6685_15575 [Bacteroidetes bacterium]|nr:hypothetical protein AWN76_010005 [Rhodothermaceae bacterium RA]RMH53594.1 MAG: hypothetical protein D6685_15575 [Bacteroidota bacterium]
MSPEEYKRIKEAEKAHLRRLKKLKDAVRRLEQKRRVSGAVADMATAASETLEAQQEMIDRLALETVQDEARLEWALEAAEGQAARVRLDEEMQQIRARELVRRLRQQMAAGEAPASAEAAAPEAAPAGPETAAPETGADVPPLPEKTIGRMRKDR